MGKVITVTANTAIDRLIVRGAHRRDEWADAVFPAGKGINVSRTVAVLGVRTVALGLAGTAEANFFSTLRTDNFDVQLIAVDGTTRINTTTYDSASGCTTHERTQGFSVTAKDVEKLIDSVTRETQPGDCVVISGSLPRGAPPDTYRTMVRLCRRTGAAVILDSSKDELRLGIEGQPAMIKPNVEELQELIHGELNPTDESALAMAAEQVLTLGTDLVVLSRGESGIIVVTRTLDHALAASVDLDRPPAPTAAVGSGDALVAAFAVGFVAGQPLEEVVRLGVACGAANALSLGPGNCDPADIRRLATAVHIRRFSHRREERT